MKLGLPSFMGGFTQTSTAAAGKEGAQTVRATRTRKPILEEIDQPLLWVVIFLVLLGMVMVYSASVALPDSPKYASYENAHFLRRQFIFIGVAVLAGIAAFKVRIESWKNLAPWWFTLALMLLILVLVPVIGRDVNGARRWLSLGGFSIQPSEIMKLAMVLYAADYTIRKQAYMNRLLKGFCPMILALLFAGGLLMLEPDLGAAGVVVCIAMGVLFLGGVNLVWFGIISGVVGGGFGMLIMFSPWRRERIFAYLDPWLQENALGKAYQLSHSLIAFGRGEWFGVGLGASVEKLHYLPEAHTDFLLAVIGEELGLIGVLVVIGLFYWLIKRAFDIGRQAIAMDLFFAGLVAKGIGIWIGAQAFINMGVNLGILPTKGLTLPLMSYGGSGIVMNCVGLAILLRVDYENKVLMRGGRI